MHHHDWFATYDKKIHLTNDRVWHLMQSQILTFVFPRILLIFVSIFTFSLIVDYVEKQAQQMQCGAYW